MNAASNTHSDLPAVIGHRGGAGIAPENTLAAIRAAAEAGVAGVEVDVRLTADGEVVLCHDETVDRTSNGSGRVDETPLADLRILDAGGWFDERFQGEPMPTLAEAAAAVASLGLALNVDIKAVGNRHQQIAEAVVRSLGEGCPAGAARPVISSFDPMMLAAVRTAAPEYPRALIWSRLPPNWFQQARALGCSSVHCDHRHLLAHRAREVIDAGFPLRCYTINDDELAQTLFGWGVDAVFSDVPHRIQLPADRMAKAIDPDGAPL